MRDVKPETINSLALKYGVCRATLKKWLKPFEAELNLQPGQRTLQPVQVALIYSKLDPPETFN